MNRLSDIVALSIAMFVAGAIFYIFAYNSGYGYDSVEYLVIGRSLLDGYPFYTFIPSKSWGLYYLVAAGLASADDPGHAAVSTIIAILFVSTLTVCYFVLKQAFDQRQAIVTTVLVAVCASFMEMNYLEPEGMVLCFGLIAYGFTVRKNSERRTIYWFLAGMAIGAGMAFKSVAGFYAVGITIFSVIYGATRHEIWKGVERAASAWLGLAVALLAQYMYFAYLGKGNEYVFWTFEFPLLGYPANITWVSKLYTKLLWFFVLFFSAILVSLLPSVRSRVWGDTRLMLALAIGLASLMPLYKTQASHYVFPATAFLGVFAVRVFIVLVMTQAGRLRYVSGAVAAAISVLIVVSALAYKPEALERLVTVKNYHKENVIRDRLRSVVKVPGAAILFDESGLHYWMSGRYPDYPVVFLNVQTAYWFTNNTDQFLGTLADPQLTLVIMKKEELQDWIKSNLEHVSATRIINTLNDVLESNFARSDEPGLGEVWRRRSAVSLL